MLSGAPVLATTNAGIGGKPANPREDNPRSQSIFVHELEPGEDVTDAVQVINNTDQEKTLLVYAVDSQVSSDGAFACAQLADTPVGVGTWIELEANEVTLGPQSHEEVAFTISVPDTASAGEQNGCIVIQDTEQSESPTTDGVRLSFRSAIRVAITVPGDITKELDFTGPVVFQSSDDIVRYTVGLRNSGNVSLDTSIDVRLTNLLGMATHTTNGTYPILANSEGVFNFESDKPFWGGWYKVDAIAKYDSDPAQSIGGSGEETTIQSPSQWIFISPEPLALVIQLATATLLLAVITTFILNRRKLKRLHARSKLHQVKPGDTLNSIAKKSRTSWKDLAKLNGLKAPYHIEPGQKLKVPSSRATSSHDKHKKST
jgi:hypothetical protein